MPARVLSHGPSTNVIDSSATLPGLIAVSKLGDIVTTRTGEGWILDRLDGGPLYWRQFAGAGSSSGAMLLYVVAQPGTPMAVVGTYPTVEAAAAVALPTASAPRDFIVMPGVYPDFRLRPGMHVSAIVDGGYAFALPPPPVATVDNPAVTINGTIDVLAADGWVQGAPGFTLPNASLKGAFVNGGAAPALRLEGACSAGLINITASKLVSTALAIDESVPAPGGSPGLLVQFNNASVESLVGFVAGTAFNGVNHRLSFNSGRIIGSMTTSAAEGLSFSDCALLACLITATGGFVPPGTGSANVRFFRTSLIDLGSGLPVLRLNAGALAPFDPAIAAFSNGSEIQNATPDSIDGTGGIVLMTSGAIPGFVGAPPEILFLTSAMGRSLKTSPVIPPPATIDANGYVSFSGPGPFTFTIPEGLGLELIPFDCTGADPGSTADITLPNARRAMAWSQLILKRIDDNVGITFNVLTATPNEFDKTAPPTTSVLLGPQDTLQLIASREPDPVTGIGRWLITP